MRYLALSFVLAGCGLFGGGSSGGGGGSSGGSGDGNPDAHQKHCLQTLNQYRAQNGVPALALDGQLSAFSMTAASMLQSTGQPHGYFISEINSGDVWKRGFCGAAGENEAPGWPTNGDEDGAIDAILQSMMNEGPGGGHYDNIVSRNFTRVGVGLVLDGKGALWFANDFSGACQ
jgi:uncharacterized protein YkwD